MSALFSSKQSIIRLLSFLLLLPASAAEPIPYYGKATSIFDEAGTLQAIRNHPHLFGKRQVATSVEVTNDTFLLERRADHFQATGLVCSNIDVPGTESASDQVIPRSRNAGLGVEFEAAVVWVKPDWTSEGCNNDDWAKSKGRTWQGHTGTKWKLTGDTTIDGALTAEYIIDGRECEIGSGHAKSAAAEIATEISTWEPADGDHITVEGSSCGTWTIERSDDGGSLANVAWAPQLTTGMPLEAIHDIIRIAMTAERMVLLGKKNRGSVFTFVTKDFFQVKPEGNEPDAVREDVLGFLSLILSFAKQARTMGENQSVKDLVPIMPRTDFIGLYRQVKDAIQGDLYALIQVLACYRTDGEGSVTVDAQFCDPGKGLDDPTPNGRMDSQKFVVTVDEDDENQYHSLLVSDWIKSIQANQSPDKLTQLDEKIDRSIGLFRLKLEKVYGSTREVPIFEFRRLEGRPGSELEEFVGLADDTIKLYHERFAKAPS